MKNFAIRLSLFYVLGNLFEYEKGFRRRRRRQRRWKSWASGAEIRLCKGAGGGHNHIRIEKLFFALLYSLFCFAQNLKYWRQSGRQAELPPPSCIRIVPDVIQSFLIEAECGVCQKQLRFKQSKAVKVTKPKQETYKCVLIHLSIGNTASLSKSQRGEDLAGILRISGWEIKSSFLAPPLAPSHPPCCCCKTL